MCGIISMFSQEKVYSRGVEETLRNLILADTVRGIHSTGMYFGKEKEGAANYYKKAIPGYDFIELPTVDRVLKNNHLIDYIVGHNRAATLGKITSANAHPFQHGNITGVHNGTLKSWRHLAKGLYDTDSEHIFAALGTDKVDKKELIEKLNGAFVLLWHDASDDTMHLIRNDERPYSFVKVKNKKTIFGASEADMLLWATGRNNLELEDIWTPDPMKEYIFNLAGDLTAPEEVQYTEYTPIQTPHRGGRGYNQGSHQQASGGKKGKKPASDLVGKIGEVVEFTVTSWRKNSSIPNGKAIGNTDDSTEVWVYGVDANSVENGRRYAGKVNSVVDGAIIIQRNSVKKVTTSSPPNTHKKPELSIVDSKKGKLVTTCEGCYDEFLLADICYVDNTPMCGDCMTHYNVNPKTHDITEGKKIC